MSRELFEGLVRRAGDALGFEGIDFSCGEDCNVRVGEGAARVEIVLSYDEDADEALMTAKIGTLLSDREKECARAFLSRHLLWGESNGASYSLTPFSHCVMLGRRDKVSTAEDDVFTSHLILFMREALWARAKIENCDDELGKAVEDAIDSAVNDPDAVPDNIADLNSFQFRV